MKSEAFMQQLGEAYSLYYKDFLRYAYYMTGDDEEARDAVQDGMYWLMRSNGDDFILNWRTIGLYYIKQAVRRQRRRAAMMYEKEERVEYFYKQLSARNITPPIEFYPLINKIVKDVYRLKPLHKAVTIEYIMEDKPGLEVADKYGISLGKMKTITVRVRERLKKADPTVKKAYPKRDGSNRVKSDTFQIAELRQKGHTFKQIAEMLGVSESSVKCRHHYHKHKICNSN